MERRDALLRLAMVRGLGSIGAHRLLAAVNDPRELFSWPMARLQSVRDIGPERARRLIDPQAAERAEDERARCHQLGIELVTLDDEHYPPALHELSDPPLVLWIQGTYLPQDRVSLSVVGPRSPTAYGHRQARRLALGLARGGATILSGLARGIDTVAHEAALSANGRTIAVIGSGFDALYPAENSELAQRIAAGNGCVISEYPLATKPNAGTFPRRNRLVAALGLGCLVIEAGFRSGSLITARLAGELGREVLALPGPIDRPEHIGSNRLLRDGATLITDLDDIYHEVPPLATLAAASDQDASADEHPRLSQLSGREREIYTLLTDDPRTADDLQRISNLPASVVSATLIALELRRLARKGPAGYTKAL
ncbi:MAG: DNA-processing protein DprA [Planctomycetota bacterium]|jgi:DNA processing protein